MDDLPEKGYVSLFGYFTAVRSIGIYGIDVGAHGLGVGVEGAVPAFGDVICFKDFLAPAVEDYEVLQGDGAAVYYVYYGVGGGAGGEGVRH